MAQSPVTHPARQVLEAIDARIADLDQDEAHTSDRIALRVWREVRRSLAEQLADVEVEAVQRAMPGQTRDVALILLGVPDPSTDETLLPLPWDMAEQAAEREAVSATGAWSL